MRRNPASALQPVGAAGSGVPPVGGSQVGASQLLTNVTITNGLFTVLLPGEACHELFWR